MIKFSEFYKTPYNSTITYSVDEGYRLGPDDVNQKAPGTPLYNVTSSYIANVVPHTAYPAITNSYGGGQVGSDPNVQGYRKTGALGIYTRPTTVYRVDILYPSGTVDPETAPEGAKIQLFHLRTFDSGDSYRNIDYIGEFSAETSEADQIIQIYLNVPMLPTDVIGARGIGRTLRGVSSPTHVGTAGLYERMRFGNTGSTGIDAIFTSVGTELSDSTPDNGTIPAINFYGVEQPGIIARDIAGGVPSLDANRRISRIPAPFMQGLEDKTIVVVGTSITTGAGARADTVGGPGNGWVELLREHTGANIINSGQGSSQVAFPKAGSSPPACFYDVTGVATASSNTLAFDETLANLGIENVGDKIAFFGTNDSATETTPYTDLDTIFTVSSLDDANTVTVDAVAVDASFRTDFMKSPTATGIITAPSPLGDAACLTGTLDEISRLATLGSFGDPSANQSYEALVEAHNPDIVIIDHMYNDGEDNISAIGDSTSTKRSEYIGAINYLINTLRATNPYCQFMLVTNFSPHRGNNSVQEQHMLDQRDALIALGKARNIPVVDIMFELGVEPGVNWDDNDSGIATDGGLVPDGTHPGSVLHRRIFKKVLQKLLEMAE